MANALSAWSDRGDIGEWRAVGIHAGAGSAAVQVLPWALIPTVLVPLYLITHGIVFAHLRARRAEACAASAPRAKRRSWWVSQAGVDGNETADFGFEPVSTSASAKRGRKDSRDTTLAVAGPEPVLTIADILRDYEFHGDAMRYKSLKSKRPPEGKNIAVNIR